MAVVGFKVAVLGLRLCWDCGCVGTVAVLGLWLCWVTTEIVTIVKTDFRRKNYKKYIRQFISEYI